MSPDRASRRLPVVITLIVGLMLSIMPLPGLFETLRPDWLALLVIFWAMQLSRTWSVGTAWIIGIVLDVAYGTLLGQHALGLSVVAYATVGARLGIDQEEPFEIAQREIRGVMSNGMICSDREMQLGGDHEGIRVLDPDAPLKIKRFPAKRSTLDMLLGEGPDSSEVAALRSLARSLKAAQPAVRTLRQATGTTEGGVLSMPEIVPAE